MFPDLSNLERATVGFTLTFFRVAGLMLFAPLFGSARIPRRFKVLIALVMTIPVYGVVQPQVPMPESTAQLTVGLLGEISFGLVLGMIASFTFIAAQWAGEMVGQQVGFNMSQVLDPQYGGGGSLVSELYFMLTTAIFLIIGGHRHLVLGIGDSITAFPPLSIVFNEDLLDLLLGFLTGATSLALRIAAPMFLTMILVDVALGCVSKTMPQLNVMSAGMAVRGVLGILVLAVGLNVGAGVIRDALVHSLEGIDSMFVTPPGVR